MKHRLNDYPMRTKFIMILIVCVVIPIGVLDILIVSSYRNTEVKREQRIRDDVTSRMTNYFKDTMEDLLCYSSLIYVEKEVNDFIFHEYSDTYDFYTKYLEFRRSLGITYSEIIEVLKTVIFYTNNPTIWNEETIRRLDEIEHQTWYQKYQSYESGPVVQCITGPEPEISIITTLDPDGNEKVYETSHKPKVALMRITVDMEQINHAMINLNTIQQVYLCYQGIIISTNQDSSWVGQSIQEVLTNQNPGNHTHRKIFPKEEWYVYVVGKEECIWKKIIMDNKDIFFLMNLMLLLPVLFLGRMEKSITSRVHLLRTRFYAEGIGLMDPIDGDHGSDELGMLIVQYNNYIKRLKSLYSTIDKKNEEKTALELSRKQAEINALVSQANPHFLYNSIECICMRSMIKKEYETASIMRHLSTLLKEMSSWEKDAMLLIEEVEFAKRYLEIQKYRFGEKIQYKIELDERCKQIIVPKLSIITFIENACVHGIEESLDNGIIQIKGVDTPDGYAVITIEDNGQGMTDSKRQEIYYMLKSANLDTFQSTSSTGILNAYLRLQLLYGDRFTFELDSTIEVGTKVILKIHEDEVKKC